MTLVIDGKNPEEVSKILSKKLKKSKAKVGLKKHFGKLKRDIDGLQYQLALRKDED
jgi:hypothetical protein